MKTIFFGFNVALVLFITGCSPSETNPATSAQSPAPSAPAEPLFNGKCSFCHGADGTAGILGAANLQKSKLDKAAIIETITSGKNRMPAFAKRLMAEEIRELANYVLQLRN